MAFLRVILFIIILYYLFRLFIQYVLPLVLFNYVGRKSNQGFQQHKSEKRAAKHEGEVTIDYVSDKKGKKVGDKGEYVDFEEIKD